MDDFSNVIFDCLYARVIDIWLMMLMGICKYEKQYVIDKWLMMCDEYLQI